MFINPIDQARNDELAKRGLPEIAYADNRKGIYGDQTPVIAIKRGETGYSRSTPS